MRPRPWATYQAWSEQTLAPLPGSNVSAERSGSCDRMSDEDFAESHETTRRCERDFFQVVKKSVRTNGQIRRVRGTRFFREVARAESCRSDAPAVLVGTYAYRSLVHEVLHALGLDHPHDVVPNVAAGLLGGTDNSAYTEMSETQYPGHRTTRSNDIYGETPLVYDIGALQSLYGARAAPAGNVTASLGQVPGVGASANNTYVLPNDYAGRNRTIAIWDTSGQDTIDASNQPDMLQDAAGRWWSNGWV